MNYIGIDSSRLHFSWVSASEGKKWVDVINEVIDKVREVGPFKKYQKINKEFVLND